MAVLKRNRFEWLEQYMQLNHDIKFLQWNIRKSKIELLRRTEGDLQNVKLEKGSIGSHLEEYIQRDERQVAELQGLRNDLIELIDKFDGLDNDILRKKYIDGETLEQIADDLNYNVSYIRSKHAELHRLLDFIDKWEEVKE